MSGDKSGDTPEKETFPDQQPEARHGIVGWFVRNHVAANLLMILFLVGGAIALFSMRTETFPSVDPYLINVTVPYPGATPYEVEDGITSRVEQAVLGLDGVKRVTSTAQENVGNVQVELEDFADGSKVRDDVQTEIDQLADFPPEDAEDPIIKRVVPQPSVITLVLYGDVPAKTLKYWAERIENELIRSAGVSLIEIQGDKDYQINIEVAEDKLRRHNLTLQDVADLTGAFSRDIPAGTLESDSGDILLRVQNKGKIGEEFEDFVIRRNPDGSLLRLSDIATIKDSFEDQNLVNLYNGKPSLFIQISRSEAQDTLKVEQAVRDYLETLNLPAGLDIGVWRSETEILKDRINLLARNAVIGYALVFLILLLFLDLKLAFWTSMGVPISFLGGLLCVFAMGLSLNMITLFALIVVLGIVVDDAIVIGESIFARQEEGYRDVRASILGTSDIRAPVMIGVMTTIIAFAPLGLVTGTLGQIMRDIPIVVISILLISLVEAFLILPAHLSSSARWSMGIMAKIRNKVSDFIDWFLDNALVPAVNRALHWRYAMLAVFFGILVITIGMIQGGIVRFIFFPQIEGDEVTVRLSMPVGTPFEVTQKYARQILDNADTLEKELLQQGATRADSLYEGMSLTIGATYRRSDPVTSGGSNLANHKAQLRIRLIEPNKRAVSSGDIEQALKDRVGVIPGADELTYESSLVSEGPDMNIELAHTDETVLQDAAARLKTYMAEIDGVQEIADSLKPGKREFVFELREAGLAAGLTPGSLGRQLRNSYFGFEVQRIQRARSELKVMVRYPERERHTLAALQDLRIRLPGGGEAPLATVARIKEQTSFATIERADGQRITSVTADVDARKTTPEEAISFIFSEYIPQLKKDFSGLSATLQGESKDRQEDLASILRNLVIALMIIFVLLGALLRSYLQPVIIMMIIPFGIVGAIIGHLLLGFTVSFISLFGIVAMTGVVINGSVVMIDYYNRLHNSGTGMYDALLQAVRRRFRPILLTTMTTSFGLLPILMETSLQARFLIPMAISLAFGLIFGSLILLFLVPVLTAIIEDFKALGRMIRSGAGGQQAGQPKV